MKGFEDKIVYRISLYGNKRQHTIMTRNIVCYDNSIKTLEWLINNNYNVEFTTPIFSFKNVFNTIRTAKKYRVLVRLAKLISTPILKAPSQRYQLLVARIMRKIYGRVYLACSLYGRCKILCDYSKSTILATSKIIGCAIGKLPKNDMKILDI